MRVKLLNPLAFTAAVLALAAVTTLAPAAFAGSGRDTKGCDISWPAKYQIVVTRNIRCDRAAKLVGGIQQREAGQTCATVAMNRRLPRASRSNASTGDRGCGTLGFHCVGIRCSTVRSGFHCTWIPRITLAATGAAFYHASFRCLNGQAHRIGGVYSIPLPHTVPHQVAGPA